MSASKIKVLMQNRPGAFSQRGGDTVLMEKFSEGVRQFGVEVTIDVEGKADPKDFDLVHLFNFALPDYTRSLAERAYNAGTPYVVTTLYEDIPSFHNQSIAVAAHLIDYVQHGQDKTWHKANMVDLAKVAACSFFNNTWTAEHAKMLFSSGAEETRNLQRDYPNSAKIKEIPFGHEVWPNANAETFAKQYSVRDYVFCVGRLESRKNQLMLLKALEDSDITVVLATGGFSYQPTYENAVRNFRRKGRTLILDKLSPEMLASAYAGAKLHCLPSWYELPGLVYLEAAHYGCNVVAGENGTIKDYLGGNIFYCDAGNENSIKNAILAAYYSPLSAGLKELASSFTWSKSCESTYQAYSEIVQQAGRATQTGSESRRASGLSWTAWTNTSAQTATASSTISNAPISAATADINDLLELGETAAKRKDFAQAINLLDQALKQDPRSLRGNRAKGAVLLAQSRHLEALPCFQRAAEIDPSDSKSLSGVGMCKMMEQKPEQAYGYFVKALSNRPLHMVTLLQLIECSYIVGRYEDLEQILAEYTAENPNEMEMLYCHAAALYKLGRTAEARPKLETVLAWNAQHLGASQLKQIIGEEQSKNPQTLSQAAASSTAASSTAFRVPSQSEKTPNSIDTRLSQLEEEKRQKNLEKVLREVKEYTSSAALSVEQRERAQLIEAEALVLSGRLNEAAQIYDQILSLNPNAARAMCGKGALAANRNDWQAAKEFFEKALSVKREYDVALAGIGLCNHRAGNREVAWDFFLRALRSNPENGRALLGLIELSYSLSRFSELEVALKNFLEMHPGDLDFVYSLAGCYYAQGKAREALEEISRITLFKPDHKGALELRDMIQAGVGAPAREMGM